ncbi:unnamed protein product, partial [Ectocarpus sp. 12 AP-2014]
MLGAGANGCAGWRGCHGKTLLHPAAEGGNVQGITRLSRGEGRHESNNPRQWAYTPGSG